MPIYEFQCKKCANRFEKLVLSPDETTPECPKCRHKEVQKIMSAGSKLTLKMSAGYGGGDSPPSCAPGG